MGSILNNLTALLGIRHLTLTDEGMTRTLQRLSSGKRIHKAEDDAAGWSLAKGLASNTRVAQQGRRNAEDGIAYLRVADGYLDEITSQLYRAAELAESMTSGPPSAASAAAADAEYQQIRSALDAIGAQTMVNGVPVFGNTLDIHAGDLGWVSTTLSPVSSAALGMSGALTTPAGALTELGAVQAAILSVASLRGQIGSSLNRLESHANTLGVQAENQTGMLSQIEDADMAAELVQLSKYQILTQSGMSSLGQVNEASKNILQLLR